VTDIESSLVPPLRWIAGDKASETVEGVDH